MTFYRCLLAAALVLAGCAHHDDDAGGRVHLRFSGYAGNPAETNLMTKLVADFNRDHPGIEVAYEPVPGQYYPKMLTMLVSHTAPDVFYLDSVQFKPFLSKHILQPLTPFLGKTRAEDFLPTLWSSFKEGSEVYGIPKDFNTLGLFYNKQMFDAAKLPYPDAGWDLDRVRAAARRLTRPPQYGMAMAADEAARYMPIARSYGAELFGPDGRCALGSAPAAAALGWYTGFKLQDHTGVLPGEIGSSWPGDTFGRGSAAMVFEGGWLIPYLAETFPQVRYGVTEVPPGPKGRSNLLFTVAYVMPRASKHQAEAWQLMEYLTSAAAQAQVTFALPSRKAEAGRYVEQHPSYKPLLAGAAYARPYDFGKAGDRVHERIGVAMQEVFLGVKTPARALADTADDIDQLQRLQ